MLIGFSVFWFVEWNIIVLINTALCLPWFPKGSVAVLWWLWPRLSHVLFKATHGETARRYRSVLTTWVTSHCRVQSILHNFIIFVRLVKVVTLLFWVVWLTFLIVFFFCRTLDVCSLWKCCHSDPCSSSSDDVTNAKRRFFRADVDHKLRRVL